MPTVASRYQSVGFSLGLLAHFAPFTVAWIFEQLHFRLQSPEIATEILAAHTLPYTLANIEAYVWHLYANSESVILHMFVHEVPRCVCVMCTCDDALLPPLLFFFISTHLPAWVSPVCIPLTPTRHLVLWHPFAPLCPRGYWRLPVFMRHIKMANLWQSLSYFQVCLSAVSLGRNSRGGN